MQKNILPEKLVNFIRDLYPSSEKISLHEPYFSGNEKYYLTQTINKNVVSSIGEYVNQFESKVAKFTGAKFAISTVTGTSALHTILKLIGVSNETEVLTQSFTFIATCNAISYCGGHPVFIDINKTNLGLCPVSLENFLKSNCEIRNDGFCWNKVTNRKVIACMPMHTFGFPVEIKEIKNICDLYNIKLVEDAAESLGSYHENIHTGNYGIAAGISFNGNKIITTGGGGMIITNDEDLANRAMHITKTSKINHKWHFDHDEVGFNYRMPNLNAALGLAQIENISDILEKKRDLAKKYLDWGIDNGLEVLSEKTNTKSNYWLNCLILKNKEERDLILRFSNANQIMIRPGWKPMHTLEIYKNEYKTNMSNTNWIFDRLVSLPSTVK